MSKVVLDTIEWNEKFLEENVKETFTEVVELVNDAIDWTMFLVKSKAKEVWPRFAVASYILHVFMPLSYGVLIDTLVGNLPACFMELRLMLETLVKCYYADLRYPKIEFFQEKLTLLDEALNREGVSSSKLMKELDVSALVLWGKLSERWIHAPGFTDRIVDAVIKRGATPGYAIIIPITYGKGENKDLEELREYISTFRAITKKVIENWKARQPT